MGTQQFLKNSIFASTNERSFILKSNRMRFSIWQVLSRRLIPVAGICIAITLAAYKPAADVSIDREEAQKAFLLINVMRQNPSAFSQELNVNLDTVQARPALIWNDTLARVAEQRAMDMATRQYFAHVDPDGYGVNYHMNQAGYKLRKSCLKDPKQNTFESIEAGPHGGEASVKALIIDKGHQATVGHRKHLLGMTKWDGSLVDIGVGYVVCHEGCKYKTYTSVVIGKHN
jgi:uncharacterized protein YkwD